MATARGLPSSRDRRRRWNSRSKFGIAVRSPPKHRRRPCQLLTFPTSAETSEYVSVQQRGSIGQLTAQIKVAFTSRERHRSMICRKSFIMSNRWYGSLGLASNVKCS